MANAPEPAPAAHQPRTDLGALVQHIGRDVRTIASDELELGRVALVEQLQTMALEAGIAVLGAGIALIGFAMLCVTGGLALRGLIEPAWLRMLIATLAYIAVGGGVLAIAAPRLRRRNAQDVAAPVDGAREAIASVERGLEE